MSQINFILILYYLGDRFAPYLPMVMAPVLRTAAVKPELAMLDSDEAKVLVTLVNRIEGFHL